MGLNQKLAEVASDHPDYDEAVQQEVERHPDTGLTGPRITTDVEFDAFLSALDDLAGWCMRIENPGATEHPQIMLDETTYTDGQPVACGKTWDEEAQDWTGPELTVVLDDNVNVVLL